MTLMVLGSDMLVISLSLKALLCTVVTVVGIVVSYRFRYHDVAREPRLLHDRRLAAVEQVFNSVDYGCLLCHAGRGSQHEQACKDKFFHR